MQTNMDNSANGPFRKIAILGLGLMGASMGKALVENHEVHTYDPSGESLREMVPCLSPKAAVENADLVILACPVGAYESLIKDIALEIKPKALVMDLGSVKGLLAPIMKAHLPKDRLIQWVGGHPMCGSEKSGAKYGRKDLYSGATFFLTEGSGLDQKTHKELENLIQEIGSTPKWVDPHTHDSIVAKTSHLPHLSAALLMSALTANGEWPIETFKPYIAGGFKDMTRIAEGNEKVWKDILFYNQKHLLEALETFENQLSQVKQMLIDSDVDGLEAFLTEAKAKRIEMIL